MHMLCVKHIRKKGGVVLSVGEAIFAIRNRKELNMSEFARMVGVGHSTISRHESDKGSYNKSVLILLSLFAEGEDKASLLAAAGLGAGEIEKFYGDTQPALDSLVECARLAELSKNKSKKEAGLREFVQEAAAIAASGISLHPSVAKVLRRLRTPKTSRQAQALFRNLDIAMTEPNGKAPTKGRKKRSPKIR